jgi:hypothetical protein
MMSINKSVAAAGCEMPFREGICTFSESEFSTSLLFGRDQERKQQTYKLQKFSYRC